jgi:hypothetical protein
LCLRFISNILGGFWEDKYKGFQTFAAILVCSLGKSFIITGFLLDRPKENRLW